MIVINSRIVSVVLGLTVIICARGRNPTVVPVSSNSLPHVFYQLGKFVL